MERAPLGWCGNIGQRGTNVTRISFIVLAVFMSSCLNWGVEEPTEGDADVAGDADADSDVDADDDRDADADGDGDVDEDDGDIAGCVTMSA